MTDARALLGGPAYERLWERARAHLERNGGELAGSVSIPSPSADERAAVGSLLGRHRKAAGTIRVEVVALDGALRKSALGVGLADWLEETGGPLRDRRTEAASARARLDALWEDAADSTFAGEVWFADWLEGLRRDGLPTRFAPGAEDELLADAIATMERLPVTGGRVSLAVLASQVTGDTKRLTDTAVATLVLRGLAHRYDVPRARRAGERRALWARVGVVVDDLSSHVLVLNLPAHGPAMLGSWLSDAAHFGEPFRVTLRQLVDAGEPFLRPGVVHVCENPAVVMEAAERLGEECAPLVCTEGQPSDAVRLLLRELVLAGGDLRVHADLDAAGVRIVGGVLARAESLRPGSAAPWRMGSDDYEVAVAALPALEPLDGDVPPTPWDPGLAPAITATGLRVFEEQVIDDLLDDLAR